MAMTREAYGQYLRGYATAAFKPLVLAGSRLTSVVDVSGHADDFVVTLSACHEGSSYGPCPILIRTEAVEDNLAEECIDRAIAQYRKAFPAPFPAPSEAEVAAESHPVAQAIAALRPGSPHIGGDRH